MSDAVIPDSNAIADAMLTRTGEILREQVAAAPAPDRTLADKVISALTCIGVPAQMLYYQDALDVLSVLLEAAQAEKDKPGPALRLASHFQNEAPEGAPPRYSEVEEQFHGDPDVFPLYFGPTDSQVVVPPAHLSTERICQLWEGMPGGGAGFRKYWGYYQYAQAVEAEVRATFLAAPSCNIASGEPS